MKDILRIFCNIGYLLLREVFNKLTFIILFVMLGRYMGSHGLGDFSFVLYFCQLAFLAADLGLSTLLTREIARSRHLVGEYVKNFFVIRIVLGAAVLIAVFTLAYTSDIIKSRHVALMLQIGALSFFIVALEEIFISAFRAFEKMNYELISNLPKNIVFLTFGIIAILQGRGLEAIFLIFLLSNIAALIVAYFIYRRMLPHSPASFDFSFCAASIKQALPFWLTLLFVTLYFRIDSLMLFFMKGSSEVGLYNAAYIAIDGYLIASGIMVTALFPFFSRRYNDPGYDLKQAYSKSLKTIFFLFSPLAFLVFIFSDFIIGAVYGSDFTASVPALQILIWAGLFVAMGNLNGHLAYSVNRQHIVMITAFSGLLINVILNLILIPPLSFVGAGIATVITECFLFLFLFLFIYFVFYRVSINEIFLKTFLSALAMSLFAAAFKRANVYMAVMLSPVIYIGVNYFLKGFVWEERENAAKIIAFIKER